MDEAPVISPTSSPRDKLKVDGEAIRNQNGSGEVVKNAEISSSSSPPATSTLSSAVARRKFLRRNYMLIIIGILLLCSMILSLVIGHQHHNKYADEIISLASPLQEKLSTFLREDGRASNPIKTNSANKPAGGNEQLSEELIIDQTNNNHERVIFESVIQRTKWTANQCDSVPKEQRHTCPNVQRKERKTNEECNNGKPTTDHPCCKTELTTLPEGGVGPALEKWLKDHPKESRKDNNDDEYPTCYLPPAKSCHVSTYTLIIMSHTTERLQAFMDPVSDMIDTWPGLTEVIIVWNSPRTILTEVTDSKQKKYATKLLQWDTDKSHPLRIFFSLENDLPNNLLNRYHPKVDPQNEAVMYFDDDGPFWSREAMVYGGFELWKRNSNVQVGGFPRNIRFLSERMKSLEKTNLPKSIDVVVNDVGGYTGVEHADFTPLCRETTGDVVEYNYFSFPDFAGHVLLPSGTFLHRNFLCFIWHPAFVELRQWVVSHKTMPDDMTVSTLISHLSGRAPRTFPREISTGVRRRLTPEEENSMLEEDSDTDSMLLQNDENVDMTLLQSPEPDQSHRRLLWKQPCWGKWREEAINSILGYFGSIHPGTVGWCASTPHMRNNNRGVPYVCHPEKPTLNLIPWLNEGGAGSNQCPLNTNILKEAEEMVRKAEAAKDPYFCGECKYKGFTTCQSRLEFLVDKYKLTEGNAQAGVIKDDPGCKRKPVAQ